MNAELAHAAIAGIIAAASAIGAFKQLRKARIIEDTPTSKIRSASQGYVELSGVAKLLEGKPIIARLSGQTCLWYRYKIERYERSGKSSHWRTLESGSSKACFTLDDNSGEVVVYPQGADISSMRRQRWHGHSRHASPQRGQSTRFSLGGGNYRFTEQRIEVDDYLYALGMFQTFHAPALHVQQADKMAEILSDWKRDYDSLLQRFDTDGNGQLDMQEWEAAREAAAKDANYHVNKHFDHTPVNTLTRPPQGQPYILASKDPKHLSRKYRWQAFACAGVMVLTLSYALYVLFRPTG